MPNQPVNPYEKFMAAMTMDSYSPWTQMMLQQQVPGPGAPGTPPPFVPVPIPVPTSEPLPSSDLELMKRLLKPTNKGWRKGSED